MQLKLFEIDFGETFLRVIWLFCSTKWNGRRSFSHSHFCAERCFCGGERHRGMKKVESRWRKYQKLKLINYIVFAASVSFYCDAFFAIRSFRIDEISCQWLDQKWNQSNFFKRNVFWRAQLLFSILIAEEKECRPFDRSFLLSELMNNLHFDLNR